VSAAPDPLVPVTALREAVRRAVDATSTRAVGAAVGVSHGAIVKFLDGAKPQAATLRKLLSWYVRQSVTMDEATATAAITMLVNGYPQHEREDVRTRLYEVLREAHAAAGREPPDWLK
jgi:hypothetical protein